MRVVFGVQLLQDLHFFDETGTHERSQIKIKRRNSLAAVHLILCRFHRNTGQNTGRLDTFGRTGLPVSGRETMLQDVVERMLYARQAFGGIIILVMNVQIVVLDRLFHLFAQQVVVYERFGGLAGKLHHHASRRVGIHVGILAGQVVGLDIDDLQEHVTRFSLTGNAALVTVSDIFLRHILTAAFHQFHFHGILNLFHRHLYLSTVSHVFAYQMNQLFILTGLGMYHGLTYGITDFPGIEPHNAPVPFHNCLYHIAFIFQAEKIPTSFS